MAFEKTPKIVRKSGTEKVIGMPIGPQDWVFPDSAEEGVEHRGKILEHTPKDRREKPEVERESVDVAAIFASKDAKRLFGSKAFKPARSAEEIMARKEAADKLKTERKAKKTPDKSTSPFETLGIGWMNPNSAVSTLPKIEETKGDRKYLDDLPVANWGQRIFELELESKSRENEWTEADELELDLVNMLIRLEELKDKLDKTSRLRFFQRQKYKKEIKLLEGIDGQGGAIEEAQYQERKKRAEIEKSRHSNMLEQRKF